MQVVGDALLIAGVHLHKPVAASLSCAFPALVFAALIVLSAQHAAGLGLSEV